jgi:hypothetical protein
MLQLINHTPFSASLSVFSDTDGVECAFAIVKASFNIKSGRHVVTEPQVPLIPIDIYWGEPDKSSLRFAGEFSLPKLATDVLLVGNAVAPTNNTRVAEASLKVGTLSKTLRIFGNRCWQNSNVGWTTTQPELWQRMPLCWELAFGGFVTAKDGNPPEYEPRNPVGRGFIGSKEHNWEGRVLPNIEDPTQLLRHPTDRPTPSCFAPIAPVWSPRREFAGTYDAAWQKNRAPYLPKDFNSRFFQVAPAGLIASGYLKGGEPVEVQGCTPNEPLRFSLPLCTLALVFDFDSQKITEWPKLETVLIEPELHRIQLLWRAGIKVDKHLLKLREVNVYCREYALKTEET